MEPPLLWKARPLGWFVLATLFISQWLTSTAAEEYDLGQIKYFCTGCPSHVTQNMRGSDIVEGSLPRENAVIVVLCRKWELDNITETIKTLEERFNHKYHYPYAFLNDQKFSQHFMSQVALHTPSTIGFNVIPSEHWSVPDWIDRDRMREEMNNLEEQGVLHGSSLSYHHMCRFNSGFFYRQKILQKYEYYWRVEPDVDYYCDMDDPFKTLRETGSVYGWVISIPEFTEAIPTLYSTILRFMEEYPQFIHPKIFSPWPLNHCPSDPQVRAMRNCRRDPVKSADWELKSCTRKLVHAALIGASLDSINHTQQDTYGRRNKASQFLPNSIRLNSRRDGSVLPSGLVGRLAEDRCWIV